MKKILFLIFLAIISLFIISCKNNTSEPLLLFSIDDFFPNKNLTLYKYNVQVSDSTGFIFGGLHIINYKTETVLEGTTYQVEQDTFQLDRSILIKKYYFRKSDSGVFYFADTSGFALMIPDSLKQYLKMDKEFRLLFTPLSINQSWPVYKLSFNYGGFAINVVDFYASVILADTLNLELNSVIQKKPSLKIEFSLIVQLSPKGSAVRYEAFAWAVKDIGFVKWDGDSEVFNFLLNENIFPTETNVKMDLMQYNIP